MTIRQIYRTSMRKINGDLLTPVLLFNRLQGKQKFLLESSTKSHGNGRFSFIGVNPRKTYSGSQQSLTEKSHLNDSTYQYNGQLISLLKQVMPRITNHTEYPFTGGAIGYINLQATNLESPTPLAQVNFQVYDTILIFDHLLEEVIALHTNIEAEQKEIDLSNLLESIITESEQHISSQSQEQLNNEVQQVIENYVAVQQQENSTKPFAISFSAEPFAIYRKLRITEPSSYMYYVDFGDHCVMGAAPNSLITVYEGLLKIEPATVPTKNENVAPVVEKITQNITSICEPDSIASLDDKHLELTAKLLPGTHAIDALNATIKLDDLDSQPHGAIGYIGFNGQLDFTHATKSLVVHKR